MNVTIINPDEAKNLFKYWGQFASVCYNTNTSKPENVGKHCLKSGHFSGSRSQYIIFKIEDCPRDTVDQLVRHEEGVCKNVRSFRYVNMDQFKCQCPSEIKDNDKLVAMWHQHMMNTQALYNAIDEYVFEKTRNHERANEQARKCLPIHTDTAVCIGFDIEALIHLAHVRLCVRAEEEFRILAAMMVAETIKLIPELKPYLVKQCDYLGWCPEAKGCGYKPSKEQLNNQLEEYKKLKEDVIFLEAAVKYEQMKLDEIIG